MLNNQQIKLVQIAAKAAGIRPKGFDGRYRMLLGQYKRPDGSVVTSCKHLNNFQLEDFLAICESHGWSYPGKDKNFYRKRVANKYKNASFAQQSAIKHLAGDLGWNDYQLAGFIKRMTEKNGWFIQDVASLMPAQAYKIIEALKSILTRKTGKDYSDLKDIQKDMEVSNGKTRQVG